MSSATVTATNYVPPPVKCKTCGHDSSRHNFVLDFPNSRATEVCSHCRVPLEYEEEA